MCHRARGKEARETERVQVEWSVLADLRVSRAVCAAGMLALAAYRLAGFGKVGLADVASASHSVSGLSEDQIWAASVALPLAANARLRHVGIGDSVALIVGLVVAVV